MDNHRKLEIQQRNSQGQTIEFDKKNDKIRSQLENVSVRQSIDPKSAYKHKFIINGPII